MPNYRSGTTLREQVRWIADRHPNTRFELAGGAPAVMGPTLEQYDRLASEFPEVAARIRLVRVAQLPTARRLGEATQWARATSDEGDPPFVLTLNENLYGRPGRMRRENRRLVGLGWHPSGTTQVEAPLTHEFGHLVMFWLQDSGYDPLRTLRTLEYPSYLSEYCLRGPAEEWAEAFRAHYHGDAVARSHPVTRVVMEFVSQVSTDLRERGESDR